MDPASLAAAPPAPRRGDFLGRAIVLELAALLLVLAVAATLRVARIDEVPPGISHDEAMYGLDARDVVELGVHPIYFERNNGGREPLFIYLGAASMRLFGEGPLAMRAVSIIVGLGTILLGHLLIRRLYSVRVALFADAWLAVNFWHLVLSRNSFRAITLPLVLTASLLLLWLGFASQQKRHWIIGGAVFGLVQYTYFSDRAVPFILLAWLIYLGLFQRAWLRRSATGIGLYVLAATVVFAPLGVFYWQHPDLFSSRFEQVSGVAGVDPAAPESPLVNVVDALGMFSVRGDYLWGRNIANRPVFDAIGAAFFYLGFALALVRWRRPAYAFVLIWSGVMILPTALSTSAPHYLRAVGLIPVIFVFPALGLDQVIKWIQPAVALVKKRSPAGDPARQAEDPGGQMAGPLSSSQPPVADATARDQGPPTKEAVFGRSPSPFWKGRPGAAALASTLALVLWFSATAVSVAGEYFGYWATRPEVYYGFHSEMNAIGDWLNDVEGDPTVVISSRYYLHPSTLFLLKRPLELRWTNASQSLVLPDATRDVVFIFPWSARPENLDRYFARSNIVAQQAGPEGTVAFVAYRLSAAKVQTLRASFLAGQPLARFADIVSLLGARAGPQVSSGGVLPLELVWRVDQPPQGRLDLAWFSHLIDMNGQQWGIGDANEYPNLEWHVGDVVVGKYDLAVHPEAETGGYRLEVGVYDRITGRRLASESGESFIFGRTKVASIRPVGPISTALDARFGGAITLVGYELTGTSEGKRILRLVWRAELRPSDDYTVFVHLVDSTGKLLAQADGQPKYGGYPTSLWDPGELVDDQREVQVPANAVRLDVGLYRLSDGKRLELSDGGDSISIPIG